MSSKTLLELDKPALIALMGACRIDANEDIIAGLDKLRAVEDNDLRARLFTVFLVLIEDKELQKMIEQTLENDDFFMQLDTPFIRKWKAEAREQGLKEGREEGISEGRLEARRIDIIKILSARFDILENVKTAIETRLTMFVDEEQLGGLLIKAAQVEDLEAFTTALIEVENLLQDSKKAERELN